MIVVKKEDLVKMLREMADLVEMGDSFGGFIEYDCIGYEGAPELKQDEFLLRASYRIGNLYGQGGGRMLGC